MQTLLKKQIIETELFADYFKFYLQDDDPEKGNLEDSWTDQASKRLLAIAPFVVEVGTVRNMNVPVKIFLSNDNPKVGFENYDLVNRCSLAIETGKIVVAGCTDYFPEALRIDVPSGLFEILIGYGNLDKLSEDGLDGDDFYDVFIFPSAKFAEVETLIDKRSKK
jgi:hypothetical protein